MTLPLRKKTKHRKKDIDNTGLEHDLRNDTRQKSERIKI